MIRKICVRHGKEYPCSCGMGNLYRFVEPVVLLLLRAKGRSCGYDLCSDLQEHALTDAEIDKAALYRTLRQLEANGNVKSAWEEGHGGPARRVYTLTRDGRAAPRGMGSRPRETFQVHDSLCARGAKVHAQSGCKKSPAGITGDPISSRSASRSQSDISTHPPKE